MNKITSFSRKQKKQAFFKCIQKIDTIILIEVLKRSKLNETFVINISLASMFRNYKKEIANQRKLKFLKYRKMKKYL